MLSAATLNTRRVQTTAKVARQSGAAAIEFAFLFPLLLFIVYATIVYGYVFFLQQTINLVAQESAKAAVAMPPYDSNGNPVDYTTVVSDYFDASKTSGLLSALPTAQQSDVPTPTVSAPVNLVDSSGKTIGRVITITVRFNNLTTVFPQIGLPGIGPALPPLPTTLQARATVRVS